MDSSEQQFADQATSPDRVPEAPSAEKESQQEISQEASVVARDPVHERTEALSTFEPSGDQQADIENFLRMTGRTGYIDAIQTGKIRGNQLLSEIRDFQTGSLNSESPSYHPLNENDHDFARKNAVYREIPQQEIGAINKILEYRPGNLEEENQQKEPTDQLELGPEQENEIRENQNQEESPEDQEKRERIREARERIEHLFDYGKETLMAFEQRYDEAFAVAEYKFYSLSEHFPDIITERFLDRIDRRNERIKDAYADMFVVYDIFQRRLQRVISSLPLEFLSVEHIESINRSTDKIQAQIERSNRRIGESLEHFEDMVDQIPDMDEDEENDVGRDAMEQRAQETKEEVAESPLFGVDAQAS